MGRFDILTQLDTKPLPTPSPSQQVDTAKTIPPVAVNQFASKETKKQASKEVNQQTNLPASVQTSKEAKKQTSLLANQQASKLLKKFGSYLTEESIRGLKRIAFESDRKDYEVLQEAVDEYLASKKK